jgi:hypothetical protein
MWLEAALIVDWSCALTCFSSFTVPASVSLTCFSVSLDFCVQNESGLMSAVSSLRAGSSLAVPGLAAAGAGGVSPAANAMSSAAGARLLARAKDPLAGGGTSGVGNSSARRMSEDDFGL